MAATNIYKLVAYRRTDDRELIALSSPTTIMGANASGLASGGPHPIGFTFHFDDNHYTNLEVFSYGFARLTGTENSTTNANLFASNASELLAPWWDTMKTADTVGYIKIETQGTAPWRRFVVEWYVCLNFSHTATDYERAKMQCVLYETLDKVEFRYGALEAGGAPARGSYGASCGLKGDTAVVLDNFLDCSVEDRTLGASSTATTSTLAAPASWPTYTVGIEPAWPMCGRAYLMDINQIAALQDRYAEPAWFIANFVNWLICHHRPALVNFSPWQESAFASVTFVVPIAPSVDTLYYDVYVETYSSAGGDLRVAIDEDLGAMPDPLNATHWDPAHTEDVTGTAGGWYEWPSFDLVVQPTTRFLRIVVSHQSAGTVILGSVLIVPQPLADVDETVVPDSGALPMSIAALRQQGAAIHPEWYNRAWRSIAAVLRSRSQMAWSSVWPYGIGILSTTSKPRRRIAIAPASLDGWPGQEVTAQVFAAAVLSGTVVSIAEIGGGAETFDVPLVTAPLSSSSFALQESPLELVSEQPVIVVESQGHVYPMAVCLRWAPELGTGDLIIGVTPPPRLEYLARLAARMERALTAYAMTGIATALCRGKSTTNALRVQYQVPPGVKAMRVRVVRTVADTGNSGDDTTLYGVSSGATANDQIVIAAPQATGRDDYPPEGSHVTVNGALVYETSPAAAMDRLLESPTLGSMTGPVRERLDVVRGAGITVIPQRDLTV